MDKKKTQRLSVEDKRAIIENIRWFSGFSPSEKIRIIERQKEMLKYLLSLKEKRH